MNATYELPNGKLPDDLINAISADLIQHTIGFVRVDETPNGPDIVLLGSGTLIKIEATYAVLTAHHVLEVLPATGRLHIILSDSIHKDNIDIQGLQYLKIARGPKGSDRPDIGAIIIAPNIAAAIRSHRGNKVFYNLEKRRDFLLRTPPDLEKGVWFVNGFIDEKTITIRDRDDYTILKGFQIQSGKCSPEPAVTLGNHDYFSFPVNQGRKSEAPRSFGGMSGGGLWQVLLKLDSHGNLCHKNPLLSGVVFYQEFDTISGHAVRCHCHGRLSIYQVAYDAIKNHPLQNSFAL